MQKGVIHDPTERPPVAARHGRGLQAGVSGAPDSRQKNEAKGSGSSGASGGSCPQANAQVGLRESGAGHILAMMSGATSSSNAGRSQYVPRSHSPHPYPLPGRPKLRASARSVGGSIPPRRQRKRGCFLVWLFPPSPCPFLHGRKGGQGLSPPLRWRGGRGERFYNEEGKGVKEIEERELEKRTPAHARMSPSCPFGCGDCAECARGAKDTPTIGPWPWWTGLPTSQERRGPQVSPFEEEMQEGAFLFLLTPTPSPSCPDANGRGESLFCVFCFLS